MPHHRRLPSSSLRTALAFLFIAGLTPGVLSCSPASQPQTEPPPVDDARTVAADAKHDSKPPAKVDAAGSVSTDASASTAPDAGAPHDVAIAQDASAQVPDAAAAKPDSAAPPATQTFPSAKRGTWTDWCHGPAPKTVNGEIVPLKVSKEPLFIGASPSGVQRLPWDVDIVRMYDRALTLEEIAAHKSKQFAACAAGSGCVLELDFETIETDTFVDTGPHKMTVKVGRKAGATIKQVDGWKGKAAAFGPIWIEVDHHPAFDAFAKAYTFEIVMRRNTKTCPADGSDGNKVPCEFMRLFEQRIPDAGQYQAFKLDFHAGGFRQSIVPTDGNAGVQHGGDYNRYDPAAFIHYAAIFDSKRGVFFFMDGQAQVMHRENGQELPGCMP